MFAKPFKIKSNNTLKNSEKKHLIQKILDEFPGATEEMVKLLVPAKSSCCCMKLVLHSGEAAEVFAVDGRPVLLAARGTLLPTVAALWLAPGLLPTITIQAPVLPKLQNGAPLYLPGVALAGGAGLPMFARGARLAAATSDNAAAAAVGFAELSSGDMLLKVGGVCMDVWHWTGDQLCREPRLARPERPRRPPRAAGDAAARLAHHLQQCQIQPAAEAWPALGAPAAPAPAPAQPGHTEQLTLSTSIPAEDSESLTQEPSEPAVPSEPSEPAVPSEPSEPAVPSEPDELLQWALLRFLKLHAATVELPLRTSLLYRNYLLPLCPPDRTLDVKKSSYKKVGKFLEAMQKEGLLQLRELERGVCAVTELRAAHPRVRAHAAPAPAGPAPAGPAPGPAPGPGPGDAPYAAPRVRELFAVTAAVAELFAPLKKGSALSAAEVRAALAAYVQARALAAPRGVTLDAALARALGAAGQVGQVGQEVVSWEALLAGAQARMTACTELQPAGGARRLVRARLPPVTMALASRSGNKKVTLVSNLEAYGFSLAELARAWQRGAAAAVAVTRTPGARHDQLLLQGDQTYFVAKTLVEKYGLPKKFVEGADKALKKKKGT